VKQLIKSREGVVMNKSIYKVLLVVCSLSLSLFVFNCTFDNNAFSAEFLFPEELLSQEVTWKKCKLIEEKMISRMAECADIAVPLNWDNPEGETMKIHVKRLRSLLKATKQMWLLDGGPGKAATATLPQLMQIMAQLDRRTDVYTLDHRGAGNSNRLSCPEQETEDSEEGVWLTESEWDACISHLKETYDLDAFTVTQAAKDLGFIIELIKEEKKEIFVVAHSYGTYLAHRCAQIFPDYADGLILDSVVPSVGLGEQLEILGNDVANDFFALCKEDPFCNDKMGDDPWGKANEIFEMFKDGHCPEVVESGLTPEYLQELAFSTLYYWDLRIMLPAIYHRIERCSKKDVRAFKWLMNIFVPLFPSPTPRQYSDALFYHITLSELFAITPTSELDIKGLLVTSHLVSDKIVPLLERWPTYETDEYHHNWASQDVPILMFHGTLDQRMPLAMATTAKENLTGPNQYFIEVPNACHGVILSSPVKNSFAPDCGMQIMLDYMKDPLTRPDISCLDNLRSINFRGNPFISLLVFGAWDLWGK
jgi:pimeloyl-ACP methyl ester carboxylesterase